MEKHSRHLVRSLAAGDTVPASPEFEAELNEFGIKFARSGDKLVLTESLELIDTDLLGANISEAARSLLRQVDVHWSIGSTNAFMMERATEESFKGSVCVAEQQTSGRGRRGRQWVSPFGKNIYLSLGWQLPVACRIDGLSLVVGMLVARSIGEAGGGEVQLKWPNDVLHDFAKVAGILIEVGNVKAGLRPIVVGVGINLQLSEADAAGIDQPWETVRGVSRNRLIGVLISQLVTGIENFESDGFSRFHKEWNRLDVFVNQEVQILLGEQRLFGIHRGVDEAGNLLLETPAGLRSYNAGEVSLRGKRT